MKSIEYPVVLSSVRGVRNNSVLLSFETIDDQPRIRRYIFENNGIFFRGDNISNTICFKLFSLLDSLMDEDDGILESSLTHSNFLFHVFGVTYSPSANLMQYKKTENHEIVKSVIQKITSIKIVNRMLVIESKPDSN